MVSTTVIGAIVGVFIGVVLLIVLITCIIYMSRKLKKKTNSRSKIISSDGLVIKDKWAEDEDVKKYFANEDNRRRLVRPEVIPWYDAPFFGRLPRPLKLSTQMYNADYARYLQNVPGYHHPKLFYQKPANAFADFMPAAGFNTIPMSGRYFGAAPIPNSTVKSQASKPASLPTVRTLQPTTLRDVELPPLGREPLPSLRRHQSHPAAEAEGASLRPADVIPAGMAAAALERLAEEPEGIVPAVQRLGNSVDWPPQLNAVREGNVMDYLPKDLRNGAGFLRDEFVTKLQASTPPHFQNELGINPELPLNWRNEPPPNLRSELPPNLRSELPPDLRSGLPPNLRSDPPPANLRNEPPHLTNEPPPNLRSDYSPNLRSEPPPNLRGEPPPNLRSELPPNLRSEPPPNLRSEPPPNLRSEAPPNLRSEPPPNLSSESPPNLRSEPPPNLRSEPPPNLRSEPPPNLRSEPPPNLRSEMPQNLRTEPHRRMDTADVFQTEHGAHQTVDSSQASNPGIIVPEAPVEVLRTPPRTSGQMNGDIGPSVQLNRNPSLSSKYMDGVGANDGNRMYFGHIDRTEHVEVKEKRRREEIIVPPEPQPAPPPPPPPVVVPPPLPPQPPRPRKQREPSPVRRRASIGHAEGMKHFVYGIPYPVPSWMPAPSQPKPSTPPPPPPPQPVPSAPPAANPSVESVTPAHKCRSIEEQERVLVIDDTMTEKSYNPLYSSTASATVSNHVADTLTEASSSRQCSGAVPKIITDLL